MRKDLCYIRYWKSALFICALLLCFQATSYAVTTVTLQWDASIEPDIASYKIYYKTGSAGDGVLATYNGTGVDEGDSPIIVLIGDLADQDNPEFTLYNLIDAEFYYFIVTAVNDDGLESVASNEVTTAASAEAGYEIDPSSITTTEAGTQATFTVKLTSLPEADVTISVTSLDETEGTVSPASLTFTSENWNAIQTVTVTGVNDDAVDDNQVYLVVLAPAISADSDYNELDPTDVTVTNLDDETAGITVGTISGDTTESGIQATFTVMLNSEPEADVTIGVSSSNETEGTVSPASLTFTPLNWNANQIVTVTGVDDGTDDDDQSFQIVLAAATSTDGIYNGKDPDDVSVINIDNDTWGFTVGSISNNTTEAVDQATFTVKLNSQPTNNVTIPVSSSDISEGTVSSSSLTFTAANWNANQTVTVTGVNDDVADGDQEYRIELGAATSIDTDYNEEAPPDVVVTNTDDDSAGITVGTISGNTTEAGFQATFTVKLSSEPTDNVTIGMSSIDETEGTVSPASLTFTSANWNANQTVTVTGVNDDVADGDQNYRIALAPATSDDVGYDGMDPTDVIVTNTDDDSAGITVGPISGNTTEAGTQATFTVKLNSEPADGLGVTVNIDVTSMNPAEGTVSPATLTFTKENWNANQTVTVTGEDDAVADGDQSFRIDLDAATSEDSNYDGMDPTDVWVTNTDDDSAGITVGTISGNTTEAGTQATFTIKLNSEPTNDVIIGITSLDTTEGTISPSSLTFTDVNWNANQTVTITPIDDLVADGNQEYRVELEAATSDDSNYDEMDPADVWVTNEDDDSAGFIVGPISGNTSEDETLATFTIKLNSEPTDDVTIGVTSLNTDEGTVSPASLTFTPVNWNTNQTVTVTGVNDDPPVADGPQAFMITLATATSDDSNYNGLDPTDVIVTNEDNDSPGFTVTSISGDTTESGGTATFTVRLTSDPDDVTVTIGVSSSDATEGTVSPASLPFTNVNWNTGLPVTVTGVDDTEDPDLRDGNQSYQIVLGAAVASDINNPYHGMDPPDVTVTNLDEDTPGFTIGLVSGHTAEDSDPAPGTQDPGVAYFTVRLNSPPTEPVKIEVSSSDETEGNAAWTEPTDIANPQEFIFTDANWNVDQEVTVTGVDDDILDGPQTYAVVLTVESDDVNYGDPVLVPPPPDVIVTNDDYEEDYTEPFILSSSINHTDNTIDITFSESVLNAMVIGNYTFDPELVINTITDLGDNTYRLHMTTSIPSYTIIRLDAPSITDEAYTPNQMDTDYINDDDTDDMADDWEDYYDLDKTVDDSAGDLDEDGWSNYEEYMDNTNPGNDGSVPAPPEIVEVIPHDGASIGADDTRVPLDTSFFVRIKDSGGINCNDASSITFTIDDDVDDDVNDTYDVTLDNSSIFKRKKLTNAPNTAETELWAVYHRSKDDAYGNEYTSGNTINILVTITDRAGIETQASYSFKVSASVPDIGDFVLGDSENYQDPYDPDTSGSYDAGTQVNGGDLDGAKILYASAVEVTPRFGPLDEIPGLDLAGVAPVGNAPMNLQPPTMFTIPARIFIPCPGYTDVSGFSIYLYKYNEGTEYMEWVLACDANGNVQPDGEGWMVPGSRENHNDTDPPTIEIKVYHFSGVGLGDDVGGGGSGLGDGGCFIATAAFGSAFEKHVKVLKEFKDVYLLSNRLGLAFVDAYERFSPPAARFIANHDSLRAVVRVALLPVVGVSWMALHAGLWVTLAIMALVPGVIGIVVRRSFVSQRAC